jgi:subtilisin family serine protease
MRVILCIVLFGALLCSAFEGNVEHTNPTHERATNHWAVEVAPGIDPDKLAASHGYVNLGPVGNLKDTYLFHKNANTRVVGVPHVPLHKSPHIKWAENQVSKKRFRRFELPTDPLFPNQWHLKNGAGLDINVLGAWQSGIFGDGVTIAMVDDGLQRTHPDISPNYFAAGSYDFNENDPFPDPHAGDDHGTSAGGVAAAKNNNGVCGSGAAPNARLSGIRLISDYTTDAQEAAGLTYHSEANDIYSNSWGPNDDGRRLEKPGRLTLRAMEEAVTNGRGGKGSIYVWAGGNGRSSGDNCNYDGYANSRFTIAIGAVDYLGKQSYYSENCAKLLACAPSSGSSRAITTTDLIGNAGTSYTDCTSNFGGTSASAPLVAGVVALILQANPNLGWRDVQQLIVNTSRITDERDADWITNGGGYRHNHKYGFGVVDASAAVSAARTHENLPALKVSASGMLPVGKELLDFSPVSSVIKVRDSLIVETVEIVFTAQHSNRGSLYITLKSPHGTTSVLQEPHGDRSANIDGWTYTTVRSWGETANGDWTLTVEDKTAGISGSWTSWQLNVYGH